MERFFHSKNISVFKNPSWFFGCWSEVMRIQLSPLWRRQPMWTCWRWGIWSMPLCTSGQGIKFLMPSLEQEVASTPHPALAFLLFWQCALCFPLAPSLKVMLVFVHSSSSAASSTFLQLELLSSQSSGGWGDQADPDWLSFSLELQPQVVLKRFYSFCCSWFQQESEMCE